MRILATTLLSLALLGCGGPTEPLPPDFTLQVSGDLEMSFSGRVRFASAGGRYTELDPGSGSGNARPTTGLLLAHLDPALPQVFLGLIDRLQPGTYEVHVPGTALGTRPEFFGTYLTKQGSAESRRLYEITGGTVTITDVEPLVGYFALASTRFFEASPQAQLGTTMTSRPGTLVITGTLQADAR